MAQRRLAILLLVSVCLLGLALPAPLWAQIAQGSITGLVKDPSGALIAGANVTATNQGTGNTATVHSQADGAYLVPNLEAGTYRVSAEAPGFKRLTIAGLKLDAGSTLTQDMKLEVGAVTQTINVSGTSSLVETTNNTVGSTVAVEPLEMLPLQERYIYNLANLSPAAFFNSYDDNPVNIRLSNVSLGGGRFNQTLAQIDGIDNTRGSTMGPQTQEMEVPPDFIQEFRVAINNLTPDYGRTAGGVLQTTIKSGSNGFHGDLYEVLRSNKQAAAGWNIPVGTKPPIHRNFAGGTVGGPIKKDKAFFFFGYEHTWNNEGYSNIDSVGLPAWYGGDFTTATTDQVVGGVHTAVPLIIYDPQIPLTLQPSGAMGSTQVSCLGVLNKICPARFDASTLKWLAAAHMPVTPNNPYGGKPGDIYNNTSNFADITVAPYTRAFYLGRWDENLGSRDKVMAHYVALKDLNYIENGTADTVFGIGNGGQRNPSHTQNMALNWTHIFSPTFFMSATTGGMRLFLITGNFFANGTNYPQQLGLTNVPGPYPPGMSFTGGTLGLVEGTGGGAYRWEAGVYLNNDVKFTKVVGRNNITFGGEYDHFNNNDALYNGAGGSYTFNGGYSANWLNGSQQPNTGAGLADFLLGYYSAISVTATPSFGRRAYSMAAYGNDDLRVTPNLTLNLGVRYEATSPISSPTNVLTSFSPALPNPLAGTTSGGTAVAAGQTGITTFENLNGFGKYLWNWERGINPRVGFAYRLFGRSDWVVRGGYGIFLANPQQNGTYLSGYSPWGKTFTASYNPQGSSSPNPSPFLAQGIPAGVIVAPPASALTATFGDVGTQFATSSWSFWAPKMGIPYTQNLNLSVEHQWKDSLLSVGYVGNLGRRLQGAAVNINLVPPSSLPLLQQASPPNVRTLRPYTQFSGNNASVSLADPNEGTSNYNALAIQFKHNYKNGVMWTVSYTWSKWMDNINMQSNSNANLGDNSGIQNPYYFTGERSRSDDNIPQRLVVAPLYELPFGKGKHFLNHGGVVNQVLGGWQISADGTWQSGSPFGPTISSGGSTYLKDSNYTLRPDKIGPSASPNKFQAAVGVVGLQYLNYSSFISPASGCPNNSTAVFPCGTLGNQSRTLPDINGPGIANLNFELAKNWWIKEKVRLNFQCNVLDIFNTPYMSLPAESYSLNSASFGLITSGTWPGGGGGNQYVRLIDFTMKLYF
jgi:hypothetical protein